MARGFNGTTQYLEASDSTLLRTPTTAITIVAWVMPVTSNPWAALFKKGWDNWGDTDPFSSYSLQQNSSDTRQYIFALSNGSAGGQKITAKTTSLAAGKWYMFAGHWSTGSKLALDLFIDRVHDQTVESASTESFTIGYDATTVRVGREGNYNPSSLQGISMWNVDLTADELLALGQGVHPHLVRNESLFFHLPLLNNADQDIYGGTDFTQFNTPTVVAGPTNIFFPRGIVTGLGDIAAPPAGNAMPMAVNLQRRRIA